MRPQRSANPGRDSSDTAVPRAGREDRPCKRPRRTSMGLFKGMKDAMDMAAQSHQQYEQPGRFGTVGFNMYQAVADRDSLQGQAHEFNRILGVGRPGSALIRSHVDAGAQVAG